MIVSAKAAQTTEKTEWDATEESLQLHEYSVGSALLLVNCEVFHCPATDVWED